MHVQLQILQPFQTVSTASLTSRVTFAPQTSWWTGWATRWRVVTCGWPPCCPGSPTVSTWSWTSPGQCLRSSSGTTARPPAGESRMWPWVENFAVMITKREKLSLTNFVIQYQWFAEYMMGACGACCLTHSWAVNLSHLSCPVSHHSYWWMTCWCSQGLFLPHLPTPGGSCPPCTCLWSPSSYPSVPQVGGLLSRQEHQKLERGESSSELIEEVMINLPFNFFQRCTIHKQSSDYVAGGKQV